MNIEHSVDKCIASYRKLSRNEQMIEWKAQLSQQLNQAIETAPATFNCFSDHKQAGLLDFKVNGSTGLDFELRLFNHKDTIQGYLAKVDKVAPKASRLPCARVPRQTRTAVDEALAVYGSPARALDALRPQLEIAGELGLDQSQQRRLGGLITQLETAST